MVQNISKVLEIEANRVNIKATTNEGMGFVGHEEGIAAFATVSVTKEDV
jgi:2-C-methyl-D-erythritol 2,4-cyclodiphosphate synthase